MADLRTKIAWLLWCANEGYLTEADRAGVSNIFTADPATLHPDDAFSLPKWLGMADALIRELGLIKVSMSEWDVLNHGWRGHRYVTEWMAD